MASKADTEVRDEDGAVEVKWNVTDVGSEDDRHVQGGDD